MLKTRLAREATVAGFAMIRICRPDAVPAVPGRLAEFLAKGRHGQMGWLADRTHWRGNASPVSTSTS